MNFFRSLPELLIISFFQDWLLIKDIERLDQACTNSQIRPKFLSYLGHSGLVFSDRHFSLLPTRSYQLIEWIRKRYLNVINFVADIGRGELDQLQMAHNSVPFYFVHKLRLRYLPEISNNHDIVDQFLMILECFPFVEDLDILALEAVDSYLITLIACAERLHIKHLYLRSSLKNHLILLDFIRVLGARLQELDTDFPVDMEVIKCLQEHCPRLTRAPSHLSNFLPSNTFTAIYKSMHKMQTFYQYNSSFSITDEQIEIVAKQMPCLRDVDIPASPHNTLSARAIASLIKLCPNLCKAFVQDIKWSKAEGQLSFHLDNCATMSNLTGLLKTLPPLRDLAIIRHSDTSQVSLNQILDDITDSKHIKSLESLVLKGGQDTWLPCLTQLLPICHNLTNLSIMDTVASLGNIDALISCLCLHGEKLVSLRLLNFQSLDDRDLYTIADNLPLLTSLYVNASSKLTKDALMFLARVERVWNSLELHQNAIKGEDVVWAMEKHGLQFKRIHCTEAITDKATCEVGYEKVVIESSKVRQLLDLSIDKWG